MIFYVSSQGHAATMWLSKAINKHPRVVCFHATRSIPPDPRLQINGHDRDAADKFARDMALMSEFGDRSVGAVHTFWGLTCYEPVTSRGGRFLGLIRHPIDQMHSFMSSLTPYFISMGQLPADIKLQFDYCELVNLDAQHFNRWVGRKVRLRQGELKSPIAKISDLPLRLKLRRERKSIREGKVVTADISLDELNMRLDPDCLFERLSELLINVGFRVLGEHETFAEALDASEIAAMEKLTRDPEYFQRTFRWLTGRDVPDSELEILHSTGHGHQHAQVKRPPEETWEVWPQPIREYFLRRIAQQPKLRDLYDHFGYWLPSGAYR